LILRSIKFFKVFTQLLSYSSQLINMNLNHYTNENYEFELPY